jgi:hypothetical protein
VSGPRLSTRFLLLLAVMLLLGALGALDAAARRRAMAADVELQQALVRRLELTDLALFNEARYTRHPSQADAFAPFQDHPRALDHFPSGSVAARPRWGER